MQISIITINYNNEIGLLQTISSVIDQTYTYFEYIIIDGGSTDGSLELIKKYKNKISYWISEKDAGIYDAMNKGVARATGEYIMFLNSGDALADFSVLEKCCHYLKLYNDLDILYGDIEVQNHKNSNYLVHKHPSKLNLNFFKNDTINHQASFIKNTLFTEFGFYPSEYRLASDYWLFLLSFINGKKFQHIDLNIVSYDFSGVSSLNGFAKYKAEQSIIWDLIVPNYIKEILLENDDLRLNNEKLKHEMSFKIVKLSAQINSFFQKFRI